MHHQECPQNENAGLRPVPRRREWAPKPSGQLQARTHDGNDNADGLYFATGCCLTHAAHPSVVEILRKRRRHLVAVVVGAAASLVSFSWL
jgi:hypothetical protein